MTTASRMVLRISSVGRALLVATHPLFLEWWPELASHLPGVEELPCPDVLVGIETAGTDLVLPMSIKPADARRLVNAHLHRAHLAGRTLCVHAVALAQDGYAVLLLGGHGAGKSLTGLALVERGWKVLAGDVALVSIPASVAYRPVVVGGTCAYLVRMDAVCRFFPHLLPLEHRGKLDIRNRLDCCKPARTGMPLAGAVVVDINGEPGSRSCPELLDVHTAASVWYRASGHLLDRVLTGNHEPLRLLETPELARFRLELVRAVATAVTVHSVRGTPQHIAAVTERLVDQEERE